MSAAVAKVRLIPSVLDAAEISEDFFGRVTLHFPGIKRIYQFRFSKGNRQDGAFRRDQTEYLPHLDMFPVRLEGLKLSAKFYLIKKPGEGEPETKETEIPLTTVPIVPGESYRITLLMDASLRLSATLQKVMLQPSPPYVLQHYVSASAAATATAPSSASSPVGAFPASSPKINPKK